MLIRKVREKLKNLLKNIKWVFGNGVLGFAAINI
jgi:hypothetical protein